MKGKQSGNGATKRVITDRLIRSLAPAAAGQRYVIWDAVVPGFGLRISDRSDPMTGKAAGISYIVMRRLPGESTPVRHTIGRYHPDALPLAKARDEARVALRMITGGQNPLEEKRRQRREQVERQANTVGAMAADFIADMQRRGLRNAREFEAIIRREYLGQVYRTGEWTNSKETGWRDRPLADIKPQDGARLIRAIMTRAGESEPGQRRRKSGGEWAAHHALAIGKTMFEWAIGQLAYGIETSPFARLRPKTLIGEKRSRQRILDDAELQAVWEAAKRTGGPYGDMVRLLILTGQRLAQVAEMQRREVDLDKAIWISRAEIMKKTRAGEQPHVTPLASAAATLLRDHLAEPGRRNSYLFSTTAGERPFSGFSKAKARLDQDIEPIRQKWAAEAGDAPEPMPHWTLHDLRRTVRSGLPALGVSDVVAEAVLAHARPGIAGVYDLYGYLPEKRDALERWAERIREIVEPPPQNVTRLQRAG
jgi:integrase